MWHVLSSLTAWSICSYLELNVPLFWCNLFPRHCAWDSDRTQQMRAELSWQHLFLISQVQVLTGKIRVVYFFVNHFRASDVRIQVQGRNVQFYRSHWKILSWQNVIWESSRDTQYNSSHSIARYLTGADNRATRSHVLGSSSVVFVGSISACVPPSIWEKKPGTQRSHKIQSFWMDSCSTACSVVLQAFQILDPYLTKTVGACALHPGNQSTKSRNYAKFPKVHNVYSNIVTWDNIAYFLFFWTMYNSMSTILPNCIQFCKSKWEAKRDNKGHWSTTQQTLEIQHLFDLGDFSRHCPYILKLAFTTTRNLLFNNPNLWFGQPADNTTFCCCRTTAYQ